MAACGRVENDSGRTTADGRWLHRLTDDLPDYIPEPAEPAEIPDRTADALTYASAASEDDLRQLADELGLTVESLRRLQVGRYSGRGADAVWSFPERDAAGRVIGIQRRFPSGVKRVVSGHKRGLTYADDWNAGTGPIVLVEGGSDTAAALVLGLNVIGRPSNRGGVDLLADLLGDIGTRQVIVIGEHDEKPDGRCPGRDGAIATAQGLADRLGRSVQWSMPPDGAKDTRSWLNAGNTAAAAFLAGLDLETVQPAEAEPVIVSDVVQPAADRTVSEWRSDMAAGRQRWLNNPQSQFAFDGSFTGAGKSFAEVQLAKSGRPAVVVMPAHSNVREVVADMEADGINAAATPELTDQNCSNYQMAATAQSLGLSVQGTACQACKLRDRCKAAGYLRQLNDAKQADVVVTTHARAAVEGLRDIAQGRDYVSIHEDAVNILRPSLTVQDYELAAAESLVGNDLYDLKRKHDSDHAAAYEWIVEAIGQLRQQLAESDQTANLAIPEPLTIADAVGVPPGLQMKLMILCRSKLPAAAGGEPSRVLRLLLDLAAGRYQTLAVQVGTRPTRGGGTRTVRTLVAVRNNQPSGKILFCDATGNPDELVELVGGQVEDITPAGSVPFHHAAVQVGQDITRRTSENSVLDRLRGFLIDNPDVKRLGVIGWSDHADLLDQLEPVFRARIAQWSHFYGGDARSSNQWHRLCDQLLILGTPRVNPDAVSLRLIQLGKLATAASEPDWIKRIWNTTDTGGNPVQLSGKSYECSEWRSAHQAIVKAELVQSAGRGRSRLPDGIPVTVWSNENADLPVIAEDPAAFTADMALVWCWMVGHSTKTPIRAYIGQMVEYSAADIAAGIGFNPRKTRRLLLKLEAKGLVQRSGSTRNTVWTAKTDENASENDDSGVSMTDLAADIVATYDERVAIASDGQQITENAANTAFLAVLGGLRTIVQRL